MSKILKVNKYCSEINWMDHLEDDIINLVVAPTGSGKSRALVLEPPGDMKVAAIAPFTSITEQMYASKPEYSLEVGTKTLDKVNFSNGVITSFHSTARLLEMNQIDLLVIDEIHYLVNYAGFAYGLINVMWDNIAKLKEKFPKMKIVALTATPHFIRAGNFLDFNVIIVEQLQPTAKPEKIVVRRSWKDFLKKDDTYICLFPSRKIGAAWAKKYNGAYIDSGTKDSKAFQAIIEGKMPSKKLFTSTLLSTGVSITDPVDIVYTNWLSLTDIAQMSSRPRQGGHELRITQTPKPFYLRDGMDKPSLVFSNNMESNFRLLNDYETWYSWRAHQDEGDLNAIVYQMLWRPDITLPELD